MPHGNRIEIIRNLLAGRKISNILVEKFKVHQPKWEDGRRSPSLNNVDVSWLYRQGLLEDGVYDITKPRYGENLNGYVVASSAADVWLTIYGGPEER